MISFQRPEIVVEHGVRFKQRWTPGYRIVQSIDQNDVPIGSLCVERWVGGDGKHPWDRIGTAYFYAGARRIAQSDQDDRQAGRRAPVVRFDPNR